MDFIQIINRSNEKVEELSKTRVNKEFTEEILACKEDYNLLYNCDNILAIMDLLKNGYEGSIDLVYIDPPFFTNMDFYSKTEIDFKGKVQPIEYLDYKDIWNQGMEEFLEMLALRFILIEKLLSDKGSIYVHLDFRIIHYVKIIMDYIFGIDNFINEIIWSYKSGGSSKRYFSRKHDSILFYSKTKGYIFNPSKEKSYNRDFKAYGFANVKEFKDEKGWYTLVNLRDVWDISMVGRTSRERLDYRTQKPEKLMERIILSSSNEGSIVADFFAGSGTTLAVANRYKRKWIGCDSSKTSAYTIMNRLARENYKLIYENASSSKLIFSIEKSKSQGKVELKIRLKDYELNTESIRSKDREIVESILSSNPLYFIDYLSIGYIDGMDIILMEDRNLKGQLKFNHTIDFLVEEIYSPLYIKSIDIFGNVSREIIYN